MDANESESTSSQTVHGDAKEKSTPNVLWRQLVSPIGLFFRPLVEHPGLAFGVVTVFVALTILFEFQLEAVGYDNAFDAIVLASEAVNEAGPNFKEAREQHVALAEFFGRRQDRGAVASIFGYLNPQSTRLYGVWGALMTMLQSEDFTRAIHAFGGDVKEYATAVYGSSRRAKLTVFSWSYEPPSLSDDDRHEIRSSIEIFIESVDELNHVVNDNNTDFQAKFLIGLNSCMKSRPAAALLFMSWREYTHGRPSQLIRDFHEALQNAVYLVEQVKSESSNPVQTDLLESYATSLRRRLDTLKMLENADHEKAFELLLSST